MNRIIKLLYFIILILSAQVIADDDSYSCRVNSKTDFSISFEIDDADLEETVWALQSNGKGNKRSLPLWTNDSQYKPSAIIADKIMKEDRNYKVWLWYEHSGSQSEKKGLLHYYLKQSGQWRLIDQAEADLGDLKSASITVHATSDEIDGFSCGTKPPEPEVPEYNICDYLTGPAQTWSEAGNAKLDWTSVIVNAHNGTNIGFPSINSPTEHNSSCVNGKCIATPELMVEQPPFINFTPSGDNIIFTANDVGELGNGSYESVNINGDSRVEFTGGEYWIGELSIGGSAIVEVTSDTILNVNKLIIFGNARLNHQSIATGLYIIAHNSDAEVRLEGSSKFNAFVLSENLVHMRGTTEITGAVTAKVLDMQGSPRVIGDISSCKPPPEQDYQIIVTPEQDLSLTCDRQPVEFQVQDENGVPAGNYDGLVNLTSSLSTANKAFWYLSEQDGEDSKLDVSLTHAFNVDGNGKVTLWLKSDVVGTIEATGSLSTDSSQVAVGQYGFVPFKFEITDSYLPVVAGKPVGISIKAKACKTDNSDEVSVGYDGKRKLKFSTAYSAPNTGNKKVELRASAASSDWLNDEIELDFDKGVATAELRYLDAGKTALTIYDPQCSLAVGCEILPDSKALSQYDIGDWTRLEGKQSVWSRPYTFALCNYGSSLVENASGSSTKGNGFIPAGQTFQLKVKPVIWTDDDSGNNDINSSQNATAPVDTSGMCSRSDTPNFYANGAPAATVALTIPSGDGVKPHSPDRDGAKSGSLTSTSLSNQQIKETAFSASWNEVGSIWLQADTQAKYLGMDINLGRRPVGRFYPAYVEIQGGNTFTYPKVNDGNAQNDFAYLGQEFNATFSVLPKSQTGSEVNNYALFEESYQVQLALEAIDNNNNSFGNRLSPKGSWRGWSNATTSMIWKLERQGFGSGSTIVESPWNSSNSQWGLYIAKGVDPTTIRSSEREVTTVATNTVVKGSQATQEMAPFAATPELRYGRMRLEDVTVPVSQDAEVPVIVEYYLNSNVEFITNDDDGASLFGSNYGCSQLIFPDEMRSVLERTPASESIDNGEGRLRVTHPQGEGVTGGYREQIRLGQRLFSAIPSCTPLGSVETSNQPWLQFNWTGEGDEDPSAVVTFGVYRGNDRIIYRGEKGMNQLLN